MTIEEFATIKKKTIETVLLWIFQGKIPCASIDRNYIPDSARIPCPKSNAKSAGAIYYSIVKESSKMKYVCARTYDLCEDEFNGYVDRLVKAGLIEKRETDQVEYLDSTIQAEKVKQRFILDCIERIASGVANGVATAIS